MATGPCDYGSLIMNREANESDSFEPRRRDVTRLQDNGQQPRHCRECLLFSQEDTLLRSA
jgi:hypothetical protein